MKASDLQIGCHLVDDNNSKVEVLADGSNKEAKHQVVFREEPPKECVRIGRGKAGHELPVQNAVQSGHDKAQFNGVE
jgi:hypothetical protein